MGVVSAVEPARRRSKVPPEHGREGALTGIAAVHRHIDDPVAASEPLQREQEPRLLMPLSERQPRLVEETALERALRHAAPAAYCLAVRS